MINHFKKMAEEIVEHGWIPINLVLFAIALVKLINEPEGLLRLLFWFVVVATTLAVMARVAYKLAKHWRGDGYVPLYRTLALLMPIAGMYLVIQAIVSGWIFEETPSYYIAVMVGGFLVAASKALKKPDGKNEKFAE